MYSDYFDMASGRHYFGCIIKDATASCAKGVFDVYEEDGGSYCTLRNANFIR